MITKEMKWSSKREILKVSFFPVSILLKENKTNCVKMLKQIIDKWVFLPFYFALKYNQLANNVVMVSGEQPGDSVIHIHVSILPQ